MVGRGAQNSYQRHRVGASLLYQLGMLTHLSVLQQVSIEYLLCAQPPVERGKQGSTDRKCIRHGLCPHSTSLFAYWDWKMGAFARQTKTRLREGKKLAKVTQPAGPTDDECSFLSWVFFFMVCGCFFYYWGISESNKRDKGNSESTHIHHPQWGNHIRLGDNWDGKDLCTNQFLRQKTKFKQLCSA